MGAVQSRTTVGDGFDDAAMESFRAQIQAQLGKTRKWSTAKEVVAAMADYIDNSTASNAATATWATSARQRSERSQHPPIRSFNWHHRGPKRRAQISGNDYRGPAVCATVRRVQQDTFLSRATGADPDLGWFLGRDLQAGHLRGFRPLSGLICTTMENLEFGASSDQQTGCRGRRTRWVTCLLRVGISTGRWRSGAGGTRRRCRSSLPPQTRIRPWPTRG